MTDLDQRRREELAAALARVCGRITSAGQPPAGGRTRHRN